MKKIFRLIAMGLAGAMCISASAFDTRTHAAMTAYAAGKSRLGSSPSTASILNILGLRDYDFALDSRYIDIAPQLTTRYASQFEGSIMDQLRDPGTGLTIPSAYTISGWLMRGAIREDDNSVEVTPRFQDEPGGTFSRVYGHFHDPQNTRGLTVGGVGIGPKAADWALTKGTLLDPLGLGSFTGRDNRYNIPNAREAMWRALTLTAREADGSYSQNVTPSSWTPSREDLRKAYWATTFRALGDVVHLLQDMAQPQHTRNDAHSGFGCVPGVGICLVGHDSFFEKYIKARTLSDRAFRLAEAFIPPSADGPLKAIAIKPLDFESYSIIPTFTNYTDYFFGSDGNADGRGLANYSNRGFYSAGTNIASANAILNYPSPPKLGIGLGDVELSGTSSPKLQNMSGDEIAGKMRFKTGVVRDTAGGPDEPNAKLSAYGAWDQFMEERGFLSGFTLNYYNYDDQAKLLIPRAVAYSTGLIDYFFRGQLEIRLPEEGVYAILDHSLSADNCKDTCGFKKIKLKVANSTPDIVVSGSGSTAGVPQPMTGGTLVAVAKYHKNTCYTTDLESEYDSSNGETVTAYLQRCRSPAEEIAVSQPLANQSPVSCILAVPGDCDTKANASTTLTFDFSTPIPINATDLYLQVVYRGPLGSEQDAVVVATKDIAEPTYLSIVNVSDYLICYNNSWVFKDSNGNLPASIPNMVDGKLASELYKATNYNFWRITFQPAQDITLARVDTIQPKEYARVAVLTEPGQSYNDEINGYVPPVEPPFKLVIAGLNQSGFTAEGSPTIGLFDYKASSFRKVKAHAPLYGYNYNTQGTSGICRDLAPPSTEPGYPPYTKPTAMRQVTITFP